jgi:predicted Rossmann fold flavoprotein
MVKQTTLPYDVIVIGGGASGMMAAGRAGERGKRVLLLEKNKRFGDKLTISGGGRCNITNAEEDQKKLLAHYGKAEQFLYSAFSKFGMRDTFSFFEERGLPLKVEANNRAFPQSENAADVVRVLRDYLTKNKVEVRLHRPVEQVLVKGGRIHGIVSGNEKFTADTYIFATGGVSHPETGSTGDGFTWLTDLGHSVAAPTPTIVPLAVKEKWVKDLAGTTLEKVQINFYTKSGETLSKKRFSRTGNVLLTHFGVSGPLILNCAKNVADLLHEGTVMMLVDTCPSIDAAALDAKIVAVFEANKNKLLRNVCKEFAPAGIADTLIYQGLTSMDSETKVHSVTKEDRQRIVGFLKAMPMTITGLMGFDRAVVADGGVPLTEMDMRTMRSLRVENLFITGDLLHVTRPSGGYSLQLCWTTGYVAGSNA